MSKGWTILEAVFSLFDVYFPRFYPRFILCDNVKKRGCIPQYVFRVFSVGSIGVVGV